MNLFGEATVRSTEPTDYTRFDPDQVRYGVGLELDLPLDRLRERNAYRATLVAFESELRDLTLTLDNLRDAIDRGLRTLEQRRQNHAIQQNALELANVRVASETLLVQAGRTEVRNLLEAQDAQVSAQNAVTAALVSYQEARLQLMLELGILDTGVESFWLKDHVAPHAAEFQSVRAPLELPRDRLIPPDEFFNN
jgi:outer membrane protein TolC